MGYLKREQNNLNGLRLTKTRDSPLKFKGYDQKVMDRKQQFDIKAYEQRFFDNALDKKSSRNKKGAIMSFVLQEKVVKLSEADLQTQGELEFIKRGQALQTSRSDKV